MLGFSNAKPKFVCFVFFCTSFVTAPPLQGQELIMRTGGLRGHKEAVESLAFSPDGKTIASGSYDKTARLWNVSTGKIASTFDADDFVQSVAFSPDGKTCAVGCLGGTVWLLDVGTGKQQQHFSVSTEQPAFGLKAMAFSPDGKTLAVGSMDQKVRLWDVATGKNTTTHKGHGREVYSVTFSPDGRMVASGSMDKTVRLWEVASGGTNAVLGPKAGDAGGYHTVMSVAFSPDGKLLAAGEAFTSKGDGRPVPCVVRLWDVATGANVATLAGHGSNVMAVAFFPDGKTLISGSLDKTIKFWDVPTGRNITTVKAGVDSMALSADGKTLATVGGDKVIRLWDVVPGR